MGVSLLIPTCNGRDVLLRLRAAEPTDGFCASSVQV
jgi:hypothetical protein